MQAGLKPSVVSEITGKDVSSSTSSTTEEVESVESMITSISAPSSETEIIFPSSIDNDSLSYLKGVPYQFRAAVHLSILLHCFLQLPEVAIHLLMY